MYDLISSMYFRFCKLKLSQKLYVRLKFFETFNLCRFPDNFFAQSINSFANNIATCSKLCVRIRCSATAGFFFTASFNSLVYPIVFLVSFTCFVVSKKTMFNVKVISLVNFFHTQICSCVPIFFFNFFFTMVRTCN